MKSHFFRFYLPFFILLIASFYCLWLFFIEPPVKKSLIIATGSKEGTYYKTAQAYKALLEQEDVTVTLVNTEGSVENIDLLKARRVDMAFLQSGTLKGNDHTIEALGSIYYEPLWIVYNTQIKPVKYLFELTGKRISVGLTQSGSFDLIHQILTDNGITVQNSQLFHYSNTQAKKALEEGSIDVMMTVISPRSHWLNDLLSKPHIDLLSIHRPQAYSQQYDYLTHKTLYEGMMNLKNNIPYKTSTLLSTTASLVAHSDLPDELVRLVLKKAKEVHRKGSFFSKEDQFPNSRYVGIPLHKEASKYLLHGDSWLEKIFPYWIAAHIDRLKLLLIPLLTLLFPLLKAAVPLYRWTIRSKIFRWYKYINELNHNLERLDPEELYALTIRLKHLRQEIEEQTNVPLSFMGEYYNLLIHVELIINRVQERLRHKDE